MLLNQVSNLVQILSNLIKSVLSDKFASNEATTDESMKRVEIVQVGKVGWWKGVLDVLDEESRGFG